MDYEQLRENLDRALKELEHLAIKDDLIEINEALPYTAGRYGEIYRSTLRGANGGSGRIVAVKELRTVGGSTARVRVTIHLARELQVWARLKHPNVLELIGYSLNSQMTTARFISPFMTNGNINEYLETAPDLVSDNLRLKLLEDSLNGLEYLHSLHPPICHADIKPENVLISDRIEAVLCDFGLARFANGQPSGLTTTKTIKGSIRYMSPELLEENAMHTLQSDIWAYGCLVLKVMTGSSPYANASSEVQIVMALAGKRSPMDLTNSKFQDDRLKPLLTKCWDRNPSARPSASECRTWFSNLDKTQLQGTFKYEERRVRIIRVFTEIHEATWVTSHQKPLVVYVKQLHYITIIEADIHMTTGDKERELKKILNQMRKWTSLKHPNVLPFLGYQWTDTPVLAFSWYKNGNIFQYTRTHPEVDRVKLLIQVASGLVFLHSESIVHGAIKTSNVIIADDGHPMLMDFGMAPDLRMVKRNMTMADFDSERQYIGYISPELIEKGSYTEASDVYAFGSLLLEIFSGQPPHYKFPYITAMIKIKQREKPSPGDHQDLPSPSPLWALMQRCWITPSNDRPQIEEVRSSLERMVEMKRKGFGYLGGFAGPLDGLQS